VTLEIWTTVVEFAMWLGGFHHRVFFIIILLRRVWKSKSQEVTREFVLSDVLLGALTMD